MITIFFFIIIGCPGTVKLCIGSFYMFSVHFSGFLLFGTIEIKKIITFEWVDVATAIILWLLRQLFNSSLSTLVGPEMELVMHTHIQTLSTRNVFNIQISYT